MDDIWREMNSEDTVLLSKYKNSIVTNFPEAQIKSTKKKTTTKKERSLTASNSKSSVLAQLGVGKGSSGSTDLSTLDEVVVSFASLPVSQMSPNELMQSIGRIINGIDESNDVVLRRSALLKLNVELFETNQYSYNCYNFVFREICKVLFKRFADDNEKCREIAYKLVLKLVTHANDIQPVLPYYMPALYHRLPTSLSYDDEMKLFIFDMEAHDAFRRGKAIDRQDKQALATYQCNGKEAAEEVRLLACQGLRAIIDKVCSVQNVNILVKIMTISLKIITIFAKNDDILVKMTV